MDEIAPDYISLGGEKKNNFPWIAGVTEKTKHARILKAKHIHVCK